MGRPGIADAEREVIRLCHRAPDGTGGTAETSGAGTLDRIAEALRRLMPVDAAFLATADPGTLLFTGARSEEPLAAVAGPFLENELSGADVNTFAGLARGSRHVATLDSATRRRRADSARYRELMRPLGLGDELRAAFVTGGQCWGYVCLHREDARSGFDRRETEVLERVGPHLAQALRVAALHAGPPSTGDGLRPGVLLLADDRTVLSSTPEADLLLTLLGPEPGGGPLPTPVRAVASALAAVENGTSSVVPRATVRTRDGRWLDVHASRMRATSGGGPVTVVLEPAAARSLAAVLLAAYGLTPRETEVARLLLRGETNRAVSRSLRISAHTVQDHVKAVFDKVGVGSRGELVARLLGAPAGT